MKTTTEIIYIGKSQVFSADGCMAISFFRPTTSNPVFVSGFPLEPGQTLSIGQNVGDADHSKYDIVFYSGAATNELTVTRIMPLNGSN
jgi:hypothetical protein